MEALLTATALLLVVALILLVTLLRRQGSLAGRMMHLESGATGLVREVSETRGRIAGVVDGVVVLNQTLAQAHEIFRKEAHDRDLRSQQLMHEALSQLRHENGVKLEEMRQTVDEKLHATLEQRLGESFRLVTERLEAVHRGLGEMQALAVGVGDLKRVLTNVKARGIWGEVQLETLLEQIFTPDQYARNVATRPGSAHRVEFAIRLPGHREDAPVWVPIDAKFPLEDYQRLLEAQECADREAMEASSRALETRIRAEARAIRERYVEPPHTSDFALLYLPTEGLFAELVRRPGLADWIQRECRVMLVGPTTLFALLNSLQMGFRTLAVEKRSSEVWSLLAGVKSEFGRFGEALAHTRRKISEVQHSMDSLDRRNRVLSGRLDRVEELPNAGARAAGELPVVPVRGATMAAPDAGEPPAIHAPPQP
jgi:DNA recombination protein RmuC